MNNAMKRKIIGITVMMCSMAIVFSVSRIGSNASSAPEEGKDGVEFEGKDPVYTETPKPEDEEGTDETTENDELADKEDEVGTQDITQGVMTYKKGTVSHVCYLYVDNDGNVEYAYKDDNAGKGTSAVLPRKEGYNLVVFIKQAKSGMIWIENVVTNDILNDIVSTIKTNDKSYKGHDAIAYGYGLHNLTYMVNSNKTKTVTYKFSENK